MEGNTATRQETIQAFTERSKRHGTVGIRQAFLQPGRGRLAGAGPLAQFVRDSVALDIYLLLLLLGRGKEGGGHFVTVRSGTWIRALGLTGSGAAQTLSRALKRLEDRQLIRRTKAPQGVKVLLLREDAKGTSYTPPTPADRYFQLPFEYWTADHYLNLDMPAKIMLLIALGEANEFEMPIARVPGWYGISSETAQHGLEALMHEQRYKAEDLIAYANTVRAGANRRQVTEYISLGLLDHPRKPGLGRGAGSAPGTWSSAQRELFRVLWAQRPLLTTAELCNFPVYLWMFWGDQHVPLRQVRKAMKTWFSRVQFVSAAAADYAAGEMLKVFGKQGSSRANRQLLAQALHGRKPDLDEVQQEISRAAKTRAAIRVRGREQEVVVDDQVMMGLLRGRVSAEEQLARFPDSLYEWARFFALFGESAYAHEQPALGVDQEHGWLFSPRHQNDFLKSACATLLTLLGASLGVKPNPKHSGTLLDPETWKLRHLRGVTRDTHIVGDGLAVEFGIVQGPQTP